METAMRIVITDWALQSYLELLGTFSDEEYRNVLRPDAKLLEVYPEHPKFDNKKFWGPCKDRAKVVIHSGYKMKWHNIGCGRVQLRLLIVTTCDTAYLCNAYIKMAKRLMKEKWKN
jgi:hypothetical protein